MEQLFSEQFMMAYASVMGFFSLMLVIPLVMGIYLVCRNKFLSTSYKLGWIVFFLFLNIIALLVYLAVFSAPRQAMKM